MTAEVSRSNILIWLILLISLVVLGMFISDVFGTIIDKNPEIERCIFDIRASTVISSLTHGNIATAIKCPTQMIPLGDHVSDEETKESLAQTMLDCKRWWVGDETDDVTLFKEDGIYCHICHTTGFTNSAPLEGFDAYLVENKYIDQLTQPITDEKRLDFMKDMEATPSTINRAINHSTIFVYARGEDQVKILGKELMDKDTAGQTAIIGGGLIVAGGTTVCIVSGPCGLILGVAAIGAVASSIVGAYFYDNPPKSLWGVVLREHTSQSIADLGCQYSYAEG